MKKIVSIIIIILILLPVLNINNISYAVSLNDSAVFIKQSQGGRCTLASAVMMLRRRAIVDGLSNWNSITEDSIAPVCWCINGVDGLLGSFSYSGMNVGMGTFYGDGSNNKSALISLLNNHPEGIVGYNRGEYRKHAVLITDYDASTDTFYCADPSTYYPSGRIPLTSAYLPGNTQAEKLISLDSYWYITNKSGSPATEAPSNVTISADRYECNVGETVNLYYTIDNAWNSAYLVLYYNNENHFVYVNGSPGTVSYTFTEVGRYYIYTKGSNDYGTSDCNGIWITVNEIPPTNVTISAIDRTYCVGETITLNYTIDRAWNSSYIVLYYNNENHYVYFNGSPGSVEYTFTEPGHYYIYTKGSNDAGTSDCYGLHIDVNEPMNLGNDFYAYIINPYSNMAVIHDNSNNAVIWERDNSYEQLWHFKRHNDGSYKITSVKSGLCLDVSNSSSETDAKVQVWEDNETTAQKWFIHSDGTNYRLRAMCTEYVLDIKMPFTRMVRNCKL